MAPASGCSPTRDREFTGLAFFDLANGLRWVETPDADVELVALSGDGRYLVWVVNEDGYSALHARDLRPNKEIVAAGHSRRRDRQP